MSDADIPWSGPPSGDTSGAADLSSSTSPSESSVPAARPFSAAREDARAAFMQVAEEFRRQQEEEQEEQEAQKGQSQDSGGELPPAFYIPHSVSLQDGGPSAPDMSGLSRHHEEVFQQRDHERKELERKHGEEAFQEGAGRTMRANWERADGEARMQESKQIADDGKIRAGDAAHHAEENRSWAEFSRSRDAGAQQHETEENRGRSGGMSR